MRGQVTTTTTAKRCTKCGETKPLDAFSRKRTATDGRQSWCKACCRGHIRDQRAADPARLARDARQNRAYRAAEVRVREAHRAEFERYYAEELAMRGLGSPSPSLVGR